MIDINEKNNIICKKIFNFDNLNLICASINLTDNKYDKIYFDIIIGNSPYTKEMTKKNSDFFI